MFMDLFWLAPPGVLVVATSTYAAVLMWLMACDVERLRWRREFSGWQTILRERVARGAPPALPSVVGCGYFACRRWHRAYGCGWRNVQRARIARRR